MIIYLLLGIALFVTILTAYKEGQRSVEERVIRDVFNPWLTDMYQEMNEHDMEVYDRAWDRMNGNKIDTKPNIRIVA